MSDACRLLVYLEKLILFVSAFRFASNFCFHNGIIRLTVPTNLTTVTPSIMSDNNATVHGEPPEDMCCLVTMEDITKEDGNYGACILYIQ
jgi:hypothetical protein